MSVKQKIKHNERRSIITIFFYHLDFNCFKKEKRYLPNEIVQNSIDWDKRQSSQEDYKILMWLVGKLNKRNNIYNV